MPAPDDTGKQGRKTRAKERKRRARAGDPCICRCLSLHRSHIQAAAQSGCRKVKQVFAFYDCTIDCEDCRHDIKAVLRENTKE